MRRQLHRFGAGGDDRLLELDDFLAAFGLHFHVVRIDKRFAPVPVTTCTLRAFAIPARPPVSFLTTPDLKSRSLSRSICGFPNVMPCAPKVLLGFVDLSAVCKSAFDGIQPTFRQTPPSVE